MRNRGHANHLQPTYLQLSASWDGKMKTCFQGVSPGSICGQLLQDVFCVARVSDRILTVLVRVISADAVKVRIAASNMLFVRMVGNRHEDLRTKLCVFSTDRMLTKLGLVSVSVTYLSWPRELSVYDAVMIHDRDSSTGAK